MNNLDELRLNLIGIYYNKYFYVIGYHSDFGPALCDKKEGGGHCGCFYKYK
ncbi:hypothetical protein GCM10027566_00720 [Arachidicoccus ginsenosidivorans]